MRRRGIAALVAVVAVSLTGTAVATHLAIDTQGHTTVDQRIVPAGDRTKGYTEYKLAPGEPYVVRDGPRENTLANGLKVPNALPGRDERRVSLAYLSQMTDFQLADEESPARVEFADPGPSSAWRPQEGFTAFQVEATIRQINSFAAASPVTQGDGTRNAMDFSLITGDQADSQQLNETLWVRDLLEGGGPTNFNSGLAGSSDYDDPATLGAGCLAFVSQAGGPEQAAAEGARYTGVQDYDDYPVSGEPFAPLYYDPDEPRGDFEGWPAYNGLMDRAQEIVIDPEGLEVPFYIANGNHDVLVQGNEDANQAFEDIATGCFKALGTTNDPDQSPPPEDGPDPNPLLSPADVGMLVPPDPRRRFVSKPQIKDIYGATDEGPGDDDHGFAYVDPEENSESRSSASYYAWNPRQTPGFRFISIDTNSEGGQTAETLVPGQPSTPGSSNGNLDDPQFQWLKRELGAAKERNQLVVIFGHHPVRSMNTQVRDEQAAPCSADDEHGHDVNPGCDLDPRASDDDPDTPGVGCIHNGTDAQNTTCPQGHESFVELIDQFPNVTAYVPGHTHEHRLNPYPRTAGSVWWEVNTSAVIDFPNQSRLVELMDNRDGTLSLFNTVVDHAAPAATPPGCSSEDCAGSFGEPELAALGRTFTLNDPDNTLSASAVALGRTVDRNAELLLQDPRPLADLAVAQADGPDPVLEGETLTYDIRVTNPGPSDSHDTMVVDELPAGVSVEGVTASQGTCEQTPGRVECNVGKLASAGTATVAVRVAAQRAGELRNTVSVRGNVSDRNGSNDAVTETTTVLPAPEPTPTPTPTPSATPTPSPDADPSPDPSPTATPPASGGGEEGGVLGDGFANPSMPGVQVPGPFGPGSPRPACAAAAFDALAVRAAGRRVTVAFGRRPGAGPVQVDVFQTSVGRRVVAERLVARFTDRTRSFAWDGRRTGRVNRRRGAIRDGHYFVRIRATDAAGRSDVRRRALRRSNGRWQLRPAFSRRDSCGMISALKLERQVFGGTTRRGLRLAYRLTEAADVGVEILLGRRVVKRLPPVSRAAGITFRTRIDRGLRRRGDYRVRVTASGSRGRLVSVLVSRKL